MIYGQVDLDCGPVSTWKYMFIEFGKKNHANSKNCHNILLYVPFSWINTNVKSIFTSYKKLSPISLEFQQYIFPDLNIYFKKFDIVRRNYADSTLFFLSGPIKTALSCGVWKRPCPNLEEVSMNFNLMSSNAFLLVCVKSD